MAVLKLAIRPERYIGASTDTKPVTSHGGALVAVGSTFFEQDTGVLYICYDGTNWVESGNGELIAGVDEVTAAVEAVEADVVLATAAIAAVETDVESLNTKQYLKYMFGQPAIRCDNAGWGQWEKVALNAKGNLGSDANRQFRYGEWAVHLNGGAQADGESWAHLEIPVHDLPLTEIASLAFTYYKHAAGSAHIGVNPPHFVISTYNPDDHDERADLTQDVTWGGTVTTGWHENLLEPATAAKLFWYGGNITSDLTEGSVQYTLAQFQADTAFKDHVVYMIRIEYGYWGGTQSAGDAWIGKARVNSIDIPLKPSVSDEAELLMREANMFGEPFLVSGTNGKALWTTGQLGTGPGSRGPSGFGARLIGGAQSSWDDFAQVKVPVNNMRVSDLKTLRWTWWQENAQSFGLNVIIHAHDPLDYDKEAEITQEGSMAGLDKAAGNNSHELNPATDQFYYYGTSTNSNLTEGSANKYGWDDFVADEMFNTWVVDNIAFAWGWQTGGEVFDDAMLLMVKINGKDIPLRPSPSQMAMSDFYIRNNIPISSGIYTPRRIGVKPVFANYGASGTDQSGIGHLTRGGYGLTAGNGGGIDLGVGYAAHLQSKTVGTDICTFAIPLNIPVNRIETLTFFEKTQDDAAISCHVCMRLDSARDGSWLHDEDNSDMYLANVKAAGGGQNNWKKMSPLADTTWQLKRWHTRIATPDAGIASDAADSTFAAYAATDIGDYYVKQLVFAYTGAAVGDWTKIVGLCINGVEYIFELNPNDCIRHHYITGATAISDTFFPQTPFRIHSLSFHASEAVAGTNLTVTRDAGMGAAWDNVDYSYDIATAAVTSFLKTWTEKLCYAADDKLVIAQSNTGSKTIGIDLCWEVL